MGYGRTSQTAHGIHMRLRSRAYIVSEIEPVVPIDIHTQRSIEHGDRSLRQWSIQKQRDDPRKRANPSKTVCFVSIDAGMGSDLLNTRVLKRLEEMLPEQGASGKRLCHLDNLSVR